MTNNTDSSKGGRLGALDKQSPKQTSVATKSLTHTTPEREAEANMFALELLMPEEDVRYQASGLDLFDDKAVAKLAKRYLVEPSVMLIRLAQLSLERK